MGFSFYTFTILNVAAMKKVLLFLVLNVMVRLGLSAHNMYGIHMNYESTSTAGVYTIGLTIYRDCSGIPHCSGSCTSSGCSRSIQVYNADNNALLTTITASVVPGQTADVTGVCASQPSVCTVLGCQTPGSFTPGIERYYFEGTLNTNTSTFTGMCNLRLSWTECCQTLSTITYSGAGQFFYTEAFITRCIGSTVLANSSPRVTVEPKFLIVNGQDQVLSYGTTDPDGDSIAYSMDTIRQSATSNLSFSYPYNNISPFPYLGIPNYYLSLPGGFNIDSKGVLRFRPTGQFTGYVCIRLEQWRKLSNVWTRMGATTIDHAFISQNAATNYPPVVYTPGQSSNPKTTYSTLAGNQLCFDITAWDHPSDTTFLSWNMPAAMSGATFTPLYNASTRTTTGPRLDSFRFCWNAPASAVSTRPYYFVVTARDNGCPLPASVSTTFAVNVTGISPVSLLFFEASLSEENVVLNWQTASETNNKGFRVQRSPDDEKWENLGFMRGRGNTQALSSYSFADYRVSQLNLPGAYYRLIQEDYDGRETVLPGRYITFMPSGTGIKMYPNPATAELFVQGLYMLKNSTLTITNMQGEIKYERVLEPSAGSKIKIDTAPIGPGVYLVELKNGSYYKAERLIIF